MKKLTVAISLAIITSASFAASNGATLAKKCVSCHGSKFQNAPLDRKNHVARGQSMETLIEKIKYYKNPEESDEMIMKTQVINLSDNDIKALAKYISKQ